MIQYKVADRIHVIYKNVVMFTYLLTRYTTAIEDCRLLKIILDIECLSQNSLAQTPIFFQIAL